MPQDASFTHPGKTAPVSYLSASNLSPTQRYLRQIERAPRKIVVEISHREEALVVAAPVVVAAPEAPVVEEITSSNELSETSSIMNESEGRVTSAIELDVESAPDVEQSEKDSTSPSAGSVEVRGDTEGKGDVALSIPSPSPTKSPRVPRSPRSKRGIGKKAISDYFSAMETAVKENDVEKAIENATSQMLRQGLEALHPEAKVTVTYPHSTDGLITVQAPDDSLFSQGSGSGEVRVLLEAKRDMQFSQSRGASDRAKVVAQAIYYLKAFERAGEPLPQVVVVTDQDEIFYILSKFLTDYLTEEYDWSIAPSSAGEKNFALYQALLNDNNLNVYVETVQRKTFDVAGFIQRVNEGATLGGTVKKVKVDSISLEKAWQEYQHRAFGGIIEDALLQVSIFIKFLLGDKNIYLHPMEKNTIVMEHVDHKGKTQWRKFPMKGSQFFSTMAHEQFFEKYDRADYTWAERKAITEIADTLIEEVKRRYHGDYWTPAIWVDEAHRMIEEQLGENWREEYVVWDPAAGSKNLTRDYRFRELYSSTLHQEELTIAEDYNPEGTAFQYDFLNDDIALHDSAHGLFAKRPSEMSDSEKEAFLEEQRGKWKLPDGLIAALVYNKPLVVLMNPPYGASGVIGTARNPGERKTGIAVNGVNTIMLQDKIGSNAAQQLYAQFIYRCQLLAEMFGYTENFHIMTFASNTYLTGTNFARFIDKLMSNYSMNGGFMLNAGDFTGTSATWGINFVMWERSIKGTNKVPAIQVDHIVKDETGVPRVESFTEWRMNGVTKDKAISTIIPKPTGTFLAKGSYPTTKNGYMARTGLISGTFTSASIGYCYNDSDSVYASLNNIGLYSMPFHNGHGIPMDKNNFIYAIVTFSVRKIVTGMIEQEGLSWVRGKDNFPAPTKEFQESDEWGAFTDDCLVASLFLNGSHQTALRDYECGLEADGLTPKKWRVDNEFFWASRELIRELAIENKIPAIEKDLATDTERYVYSYLQPRREAGALSAEAEALLSKATEILSASFKYRAAFFEESPVYSTLSWDMGWLQIQRMCFGRDALSFAKADNELQALYAEFNDLRSALGEKIAARYSEDTGF